jgi:hypothetical protein
MSRRSQIVGGRLGGFAGYWHLTRDLPGQREPSVHLINCGKTSGGWSDGGTVRNPAGHRATYHITVLFTAPGGAHLASSTAVVPLASGGSDLWSTAASFHAPASVRCVLWGVAAT